MYDYEVKLIDFGCCKYLGKKEGPPPILSGIVGTCIYCSPEVIDDLYDEKSDEWSCGVLMYILLCGVPPFVGDTEEEIYEQIKKGKYSFDRTEFKNVSENCKKLIKKLLEPNSKKRIKASKALHEPFFNENYNKLVDFDMFANFYEYVSFIYEEDKNFENLLLATWC